MLHVRRVWKRFFFIVIEHVVQNHSAAFQKYKDNFSPFSSELLEEHLVCYEIISTILSYQFFLIVDVLFHLPWFFYLIFYLVFYLNMQMEELCKKIILSCVLQ